MSTRALLPASLKAEVVHNLRDTEQSWAFVGSAPSLGGVFFGKCLIHLPDPEFTEKGLPMEIQVLLKLRNNASFPKLRAYALHRTGYFMATDLLLPEPLPLSAKRLFFPLVSAVVDLHRAGFMSRDIKLSNLLWTPGLTVCDFDLAHPLPLASGVVGSDGFMAPEILAGGQYNEKVDIYAAGVCLLALELGLSELEVAYHLGTREQKVRALGSIEPGLALALAPMLSADPEKRPSAAACLLSAQLVITARWLG